MFHGKEVKRFIAERKWEKWVASVELHMTSENGCGGRSWMSAKNQERGVNSLMGSYSPGGR
jgi:hypothetical protein